MAINFQGVYFRKHAKEKAESLGLRGWIRNSRTSKTVLGQMEGGEEALEEMKRWLRFEGSPKSGKILLYKRRVILGPQILLIFPEISRAKFGDEFAKSVSTFEEGFHIKPTTD